MGNLLLIALAAALVNNVVLSKFLGLCPFIGVSKKTNTAAGMGGAVITAVCYPIFITVIITSFGFATLFAIYGTIVKSIIIHRTCN